MERELSEREIQVIRFAAMGLTDKEMAHRLGVSLATIRTYWERLRVKTKTRSRTHAVCQVLLGNQGASEPIGEVRRESRSESHASQQR